MRTLFDVTGDPADRDTLLIERDKAVRFQCVVCGGWRAAGHLNRKTCSDACQKQTASKVQSGYVAKHGPQADGPMWGRSANYFVGATKAREDAVRRAIAAIGGEEVSAKDVARLLRVEAGVKFAPRGVYGENVSTHAEDIRRIIVHRLGLAQVRRGVYAVPQDTKGENRGTLG